MQITALSLVVLLFAGCTPVPEAPGDLADLSRYLFREWENDDPRVMEAGIAKFEEQIAGFDLDGERSERSYEADPLHEDDLAAIRYPEGADLELMIGVALARRSAWEPIWHARLALLEDQSLAEPSSAEYTRAFVDPTDPSCFPGQECEVMHTRNDVLKVTAAYSAWMELWKSFRWVDVVVDGEDTGRDAMVARVWAEESFEGEQGNTALLQSYALDTWIDTAADGPVRLQVNWSQTTLSSDEQLVRSTVRLSMDQLFEQTDVAIEELLDP